MPEPKFVLFYEAADDVLETAPTQFPAHSARLDEFHTRGELLLVGTWEDDIERGSMSVFASREAAEAFVADDPFVVHGVVANWRIRQWNEVLAGEPPT